MVDSHPYVHGKRLAMVGDPDVLLGLISFVLEIGMKPVHVVCTNGDKKFKKAAEAMLAASPFGAEATVWIKKDMWHLRSLMFTEPVDLLLGPRNAKFLWKDTGTTFVRVGFPLFDRHHLHKRADPRLRGRDEPAHRHREHRCSTRWTATRSTPTPRPSTWSARAEATMALSLDKLLADGCSADAKHKVCRVARRESRAPSTARRSCSCRSPTPLTSCTAPSVARATRGRAAACTRPPATSTAEASRPT